MSITTAPYPVAAAKGKLSTPQVLRRALWALWAGDLLLVFLMLTAHHVQYSALSTIGRDSAPSIIAAQRIKSAVADMDADAANELLTDSAAASASVQAYNARRQEAAIALIAAAQNITYGDAERIPIVNIQLALGTYEALIQRARDLRQDRNPLFLDEYNKAAQLLDTKIMPAADALDAANLSELDGAYAGQRSRSLAARTALGGSTVAVLLLLVYVQASLFRRTHRVLNIPLFVATAVLLFFGLSALAALSSAEKHLKRAKEDAFTSVHALWRARAVAYAANANESRFLLDPRHAAERETAFYTQRDLLARVPEGVSYENIQPSGFTGYLADELNNISFPGEQEAATETLSDFGRYIAIDKQIRALERSGQHAQAIALCTGTAPGQSDWAFGQFDDALGRTLTINQEAFDTSVAAGFAALRGFTVKVAIFAAVLALLCLGGLLQRLREYR